MNEDNDFWMASECLIFYISSRMTQNALVMMKLTTLWCHEAAKIGPRTKSKELDYEACNFDHRDFCHCLGKGIQKVMSLRGELRLCSNSAVHAVTSRKT